MQVPTSASAWGRLQAWDSQVLSAGRSIIILAVFAIAAPGAAVLAPSRPKLLIGAGRCSFGHSLSVLVAAKIALPIPLAALLAIAPFIAVALFLSWSLEQRAK